MLLEIKNKIEDDDLVNFLWNETREGMAFVSNSGVMELVNPAFARLLGYTPRELEGKTFAEITLQSDIEADLAEFKKLLDKRIHSYTMTKSYITKMRQIVTVNLRAVNYKDGALVLGQVLPLDTLSLDQLPREEAKRVLAMLVGRWAVENWKLLLLILSVVAGISNIGEILGLLK